MNRRVVVIAAAVLVLILAGVWLLHGHQRSPPHVTVAGGDGGGLPRAQPLDERIDATALERAAGDRGAEGLQAFVVMRHGHIVFERYRHGLAGDSMIDGGHFAEVLVAMAAGVAGKEGVPNLAEVQGFDPQALRAAIESGTQQRYEIYLSHKLWSRLNSAPAWIELAPGATAAPADCCFHARVLDWMRIASLLVDDGRFEGKQILPPGWIARMQRPLSLDAVRGLGVELAPAAHGAEAFASPGVFFVRGPGRWRLWLVPPLQLAVLFGAEDSSAGAWDETRLPNMVIRAVSDRPQQPGDMTDLQRLVPGH
jgi:hypothetical protein